MFSARLILSLMATAPALVLGSLEGWLKSQPDLSTFVSLTDRIPGLLGKLDAGGPITIFAPTNAAFQELAQWSGTIEQEIAKNNNATQTLELLNRHILGGDHDVRGFENPPRFFPSRLLPGELSEVSAGVYLGTTRDATGPRVIATSVHEGQDGAAVLSPSNHVGNVTVNKIDRVLRFAPTIASWAAYAAPNAAKFSALYSEFRPKTPLELKDTTVFVPSDAAFAKAEAAISKLNATQKYQLLRHHIVKGVYFSPDLTRPEGTRLHGLDGRPVNVIWSGSRILVGGAPVSSPNLILLSGAAHVIDDVLNPFKIPPPDHS